MTYFGSFRKVIGVAIIKFLKYSRIKAFISLTDLSAIIPYVTIILLPECVTFIP